MLRLILVMLKLILMMLKLILMTLKLILVTLGLKMRRILMIATLKSQLLGWIRKINRLELLSL